MGNNFKIGEPKQPLLSPADYDTIKCDNCGAITFTNAVVLKRIPGMLVGAGTEDVAMPLNVYVCTKCGTILKDDRDKLDELDKKGEEKPKSSLIL